MSKPDPCEEIVRQALDDAGIAYNRNVQHLYGREIDFFLPDHGVLIEVKQFYTARAIEQLRSLPNCILLQGRRACELFAQMTRDSVRNS